jgi:hypothetical protein
MTTANIGGPDVASVLPRTEHFTTTSSTDHHEVGFEREPPGQR